MHIFFVLFDCLSNKYEDNLYSHRLSQCLLLFRLMEKRLNRQTSMGFYPYRISKIHPGLCNSVAGTLAWELQNDIQTIHN